MLIKKIPLIILIAMTLIGLGIAISQMGNETSNKYKISGNQRSIPPTPITKYKNNRPTDLNGNSYAITKKTFTSQGVKITYPQITHYHDPFRQKQINEIIKNEALKIRNYYPEAGPELTLEIDHEIKWRSANLLSILYSGVGYLKGAAYPNRHFYTTNINIRDGNRLRLKDLVSIDENLVKIFKNVGLKALRPEHNDVLNDYTDDEFLAKLNKADSPDQPVESETFSYITQDSLGLSFSVPHALGDHAEFEIKLQEIINYLKIVK